MKITKTNKMNTKSAGIFIIAAILLLATGAYAAHMFNIWPFNPSSETTEEHAANSSDATNPTQKIELQPNKNPGSSQTNKTTDQIPVSTEGKIIITLLEQANDAVTYTGLLESTKTPGTCSALFEHDAGAARPVTRTYMSENNQCPETTIPLVEFAARGSWTLTLRYYVDDTQLVTKQSFEVK